MKSALINHSQHDRRIQNDTEYSREENIVRPHVKFDEIAEDHESGYTFEAGASRLSRRDIKQEEKRNKLGKRMKYCCKRLSIAKHSHGLYYKDMQSFACPTMGFVTLFGILMVFIFTGVTLYNIQNKNNNNV